MKKSINGDDESRTARIVEELEKLPISIFAAVGNEDERLRRRARLIEFGKTHRLASERFPENDEPVKSPQPSPDSGGKRPETDFGFLHEICREGDPLIKHSPDDPDRACNRNDLDMERE